MEIFFARCTLFPPDYITADVYGNTKAALAKKGKPIPDNDTWIAEIALQHNLPLYTNDAHFREIDGLQLFNPLSSI